MSEAEEEIVVCYSCRAPMNVASLPPYTRVACPSCGTESRVKKQFGPYVLNRRHAIGGMSSVFVATDEALGREVALKILSEEYSGDEKRITAFEEEARLTASFSHPHVVRVFTTGRAFDRFYIAMELVPGGHFERQIRERGRIPEKELLPLAIQVAEGLKGAQAAGLIHRDVKPGNILLDAEGHAKLVDFGLALVTKGGKAKAEEIWATPYYVPPEAIEGAVEDFRSDIYAFGATFYHALAGKPPCDEESMATDVLREAKKRIIPLKKAAPDLCAETCAVIDRAMAYDPAGRFTSYDEMIAALRTALKVANGEIASEANSGTKAIKRLESRRKKQRRTLLSAAGLLILSAGVFWALSQNGKSGRLEEKPRVVTVVSEPLPVDDSSQKIAGIYRSARNAMERGEFRVAEDRFAALLENNDVLEPTRTWAGLEAVLAAMMDGRMNDARRHARSARMHIADSAGSGNFRQAVLPVLERFQQPGFYRLEDLSKGSVESRMAAFMAGLKNWEQGGLSQALPMLEEVAGDESLEADGVMSFYHLTAQRYVRDHGRLNIPAYQEEPSSPAACREAIEELNRTLTLLETRGRAPFNVRARQLDLGKLEKSYAKPPVEIPSSADDGTWKRVQALARFYRFSDIQRVLEALETDPPGCSRDSLIRMNRASLDFIEEMEADLEKAAVNVPLELKNGSDVISVVKRDGKLFCKLAEGTVRQFEWTDLSGDGILTLHEEILKNTQDAEARMRKIEGAIAFDWLTGDRSRAMEKATALAEKNEDFKQRWSLVAHGLPK